MFDQNAGNSQLGGAQRELERTLSALRPSAPAFAVADVRAAALLARQRRLTRVWQGVAAVLAIAAGILAFARPAPRSIERERERVVYVPAAKAPDAAKSTRTTPPAPAPPLGYALRDLPPPSGFAYLQMRQTVLALGVESLRANRPVAATADATPTAWRTPGAVFADDSSSDAGVPAPADHAPRFLDYLLPGGKS